MLVETLLTATHHATQWREFRARLISGGGLAGLKTTAEDDGGEVADEAESPATVDGPEPTQVAPRNMELLKTQVGAPSGLSLSVPPAQAVPTQRAGRVAEQRALRRVHAGRVGAREPG